jgi:hypothetical protein
VVFVGVGGDQVIDPGLVLERQQLFRIAGRVDDRPDPAVNEDGIAVGVRASANEFYRALGKIVQFVTISLYFLGERYPLNPKFEFLV